MNTLTKVKISDNVQTGAEAIVSTLIKLGIDTVFGYPGTPVLSVYEALSKSDKIRHVLSRHEQGSVHAAEGYAKVSGKCGVVLVTSGPGFTNALTGLANAKADYTPIVVLTVHPENLDRNEFQNINVGGVAKNLTKNVHIISSAEDISHTLALAVNEATTLPYSTVVVSVSKSVLETSVTQKPYRIKKDIKVEAPHSCVLKSIESLRNAHRPLVIVGGGCSGAEEDVKEFCRLTNIPVVNTLMAKGVADDISMGMIGSNGNDYLNEKISESDVVLALGVRFTDRTTKYVKEFLPDSKIININIQKNNSQNVHINKELTGEVKVVLQQIIGVIKAKNILFDIKYDWIESLYLNKNSEISGDVFSQENVLTMIYKASKKYNPVITTDVGEHQIIASKVFKTHSSKNFLLSGGFGTMGVGLPFAVGAYLAKPNSLVINITGDGSFQMNMQELGTIAQYNIPVKLVIMNNSSLGMISNHQRDKNYSNYQSDLLNPDFVKIASAYGIKGYTITNMSELNQALKEIFVYKKAVLLNIKL